VARSICGLLTVPPSPTEGLLYPVGPERVPGRPSVGRSDTVGRPCHNTFVLCEMLAHNVCCVIVAWYKSGVDPLFSDEEACGDGPQEVLRFPQMLG
jgi:hypothetical protein